MCFCVYKLQIYVRRKRTKIFCNKVFITILQFSEVLKHYLLFITFFFTLCNYKIFSSYREQSGPQQCIMSSMVIDTQRQRMKNSLENSNVILTRPIKSLKHLQQSLS